MNEVEQLHEVIKLMAFAIVLLSVLYVLEARKK